jgi:clan AA aspartic protease (TIGR02281 family)
MRRLLILCVGIVIGQWLAFSSLESPADVDRLARAAWARADFDEAARQWSRAVSLQPHNAYFNYMRASALARLGHHHAAADALQVTLLLQPAEPLARQIRDDLSTLTRPLPSVNVESAISLESARGVWVVPVVVNGRYHGRFLVDTGASVVVLSPKFAAQVAAKRRSETLEMETLGGRAHAPWATVSSLRVGNAEVLDAQVVIHPAGGDLDGILGNTFLNRWDVSVEPDRRLLRLRPLQSGDAALYASPR